MSKNVVALQRESWLDASVLNVECFIKCLAGIVWSSNHAQKESITNLSSPALETEVSVIKMPTAEEEHLNLW